MGKKYIYSILIFVISILLSGCTEVFNMMNYSSKKPSNFYYTDILLKSITSENPSKSVIIENNFHKGKQLDGENISDIRNMLKSLNKNSFIKGSKNIPQKPAYKIILTFKHQKLLMNVYNEKYMSVYPWDGDYTMDYIDISKLPVSINPYNLGKYIFKQ